MPAPLYMLDTNIIMALVRGRELGRYIDQSYELSQQVHRPLVCIVTHGEIWLLAKYHRWGKAKIDTLKLTLDNLVAVDISNDEVIQSYVEIDLFSRKFKSAITMEKNDVWIAAAAKAANAVLLTTDKGFNHLPQQMVKHIYIDSDTILTK